LVFGIVYMGIIIIMEHNELPMLVNYAKLIFQRKPASSKPIEKSK